MTSQSELPAGPVFQRAGMQDLPALAEHLEETCRRVEASDEVSFAVRLAVEEAFTNIVQHGYGGHPGPIRVDIRREDGALVVTLEDEAPPFDPSQAPAPLLEGTLEEREPGGLGWHLVRQMMDEVRHQAVDGGGNVLTLVKKLA